MGSKVSQRSSRRRAKQVGEPDLDCCLNHSSCWRLCKTRQAKLLLDASPTMKAKRQGKDITGQKRTKKLKKLKKGIPRDRHDNSSICRVALQLAKSSKVLALGKNQFGDGHG
uniref:Uncharacterized protein n=1 Tax=Solanum tuberosum TaxID=4113 RepID=M1DFX8_SOLTU